MKTLRSDVGSEEMPENSFQCFPKTVTVEILHHPISGNFIMENDEKKRIMADEQTDKQNRRSQKQMFIQFSFEEQVNINRKNDDADKNTGDKKV